MNRVYRGAIYTLGVFTLAAGVSLNTKTGLGVSPIISVSYSAADILDMDFGFLTFVLYALFIALQILICRRARFADFLQFPFSVVFSFLLNGFGELVWYDSAKHGLAANLALLALAVLLTGAGMSMMLNMRLIPNPADGVVQALSQRMGWEQGFSKNVLDLSCVIVTCVMSFLAVGRIVGIGLGTLAAMLGTGRAVALTNYLFKEKMRRAAGLA